MANSRAQAATVLFFLVLSANALAHAMLDHSSPRVGSSVSSGLSRVELWFSEPLEPAFSTVKVIDSLGRQVDGRDPEVDKGDRRHLGVSVIDLPVGRYRVVWRVASADAHATQGDFTFDVSR